MTNFLPKEIPARSPWRSERSRDHRRHRLLTYKIVTFETHRLPSPFTFQIDIHPGYATQNEQRRQKAVSGSGAGLILLMTHNSYREHVAATYLPRLQFHYISFVELSSICSHEFNRKLISFRDIWSSNGIEFDVHVYCISYITYDVYL